MEIILGKDAYMEVKKNGSWVPYVCCETVEVTITTESKSVKTVGDGQWDTVRAQKHAYSISGSGVVQYDDATKVNGFDLVNYQIQGVHVEYRMIFKKMDQTDYTMIYGFALVTSNTFSAPSDFVSHSFEMRGSGPINIGIMPTCAITITGFTHNRVGLTSTFTVTSTSGGTPIRYDYVLTGPAQSGSTQTSYNNSWSLPTLTSVSYTIKVQAMCENGVLGPVYTLNFST